jgi:ubiquinone/menaquinone biosynthesis C-methylase UbiE
MNFIELFRMAKNRFKSDNDYVAFQQFQATEIIKDIEKILKVEKTSFVIDWGCGSGGYTSVFSKIFREVKGIDFYVETEEKDDLNFESHDLMNYISAKKADFVFCASVIEHVSDPKKFIKKIYDSLKMGGKLYLSFPPFYSIGGGHQLKPFHYLPDSIAIWIGKKLKRICEDVKSYENLAGTWGLYKLKIDDIKSILEESGFKICKYKPRYFSYFDTTKIPLINDFLTWHVEFYCVKQNKG